MLRLIYRILVALILFYKKFCVELENIIFEFNTYGTCVANRIKVVKKHTVRLHVEDAVSIHMNPKAIYKFKE